MQPPAPPQPCDTTLYRPSRIRPLHSAPHRRLRLLLHLVLVLLTVVAVSYRQVCRAYPSGGGAYAVARENLTQGAGLVAAAALFIDYVMTVAVSTASAVSQAYSVVPALYDVRIELALAAIVLITMANLRGLRESGNIFAVPTYAFVGLAFLLIGVGLFHIATGSVTPLPTPQDAIVPPSPVEAVTLLMLLHAFAGGSVALTGVEAIANGVPAFKPPEAKNAANTLVVMAVLLAVLFIGITVMAEAWQIVPSEEGSGGPTVIAMVAAMAFGDFKLISSTGPGLALGVAVFDGLTTACLMRCRFHE